MAVKKKGLGKGLDSLIPEKSNKPLAKEPAEEKRIYKRSVLLLAKFARTKTAGL